MVPYWSSINVPGFHRFLCGKVAFLKHSSGHVCHKDWHLLCRVIIRLEAGHQPVGPLLEVRMLGL